MTRRGRRTIAVAVVVVVVGSAGAAWGEVNTFVALPQVRVVEVSPPGAGSGTGAFRNNTVGVDIAVDSIVPVGACASGVSVDAGDLPVTVPEAGGEHAFDHVCAGGPTSGMRRCTWQARDPNMTPLTTFETVCQYASLPNLAASMTAIDFGMVPVGGEIATVVQLDNTGGPTFDELYFQTTDLPGNFKIGSPCNPDARECDALLSPVGDGSAASVTVKCTPQSAGKKTAELYIASNAGQRLSPGPVVLSCTGVGGSAPVISVGPSPLDLGPVEVNGAMGGGTITIGNAGGGTLQIQSVVVTDSGTGTAADWSYDASGACTGNFPPICNLSAGEAIALDVDFDPSAIGSRDAALLINYRDTVDKSLSVPLRGIGRGATLQLAGGTVIDFGVRPIGVASTVMFQLANAGNRDLMSVTLSAMPAGAPFAIMPASTTVPAAMPRTITATCTPQAVGTFATMFRISSPDAVAGSPIEIMATCQGTDKPLFADPGTVLLDEIRTEVVEVRRQIRALSNGPTIALSGVALETPDPNLSLGALSQMTTPATFDLIIRPRSDVDFAASPNAVIVTPATGAPVRVPIGGKIVTAAYEVPAMISLGTFCVEQSTTSSPARLMSTGAARIRLDTPAMTLLAMSPFDVRPTSPQSYPAVLPAGGIATVEVTPRRRSAPGTASDDLVWSTDVAAALEARTALSAEFISDGAAVAPSALQFGKVPIHIYTMNAQAVTLQNCESTVIELDRPQIAPPFVIDSPNFPTQLEPSEAATFTVGFHPTKAGVFERELVISSPTLDLPLAIALAGEGVTGDGDGGPDDDRPDPTSFYACTGCASGDASHVLGWLAMVIAVMSVCALPPRRRRR